MEYEKEEAGDVMQLFPQKPKRASGAARRASKPSGKMIAGIWSRTFLKAMKEKGALINGRDDYYREEDWRLSKNISGYPIRWSGAQCNATTSASGALQE